MESEGTLIPYYVETCWLTRAKVLHSVFELKEEIHIFLSDGNGKFH
jgi:hypothetical protein